MHTYSAAFYCFVLCGSFIHNCNQLICQLVEQFFTGTLVDFEPPRLVRLGLQWARYILTRQINTKSCDHSWRILKTKCRQVEAIRGQKPCDLDNLMTYPIQSRNKFRMRRKELFFYIPWPVFARSRSQYRTM